MRLSGPDGVLASGLELVAGTGAALVSEGGVAGTGVISTGGVTGVRGAFNDAGPEDAGAGGAGVWAVLGA